MQRSRSETDARKDLRVTDRNSRTRSVRTNRKQNVKTINLTVSVASSVVLLAETIAMAKADIILQNQNRQSSRHPTYLP